MNAAWDRAFPQCQQDAAGRRTLQSLRFGIRALTTPPWAQDIGHADHNAVQGLLNKPAAPLQVLDLPAGQSWSAGLPRGAWTLERHTRQVRIGDGDPIESWPATRRKQLRRVEREGFAAEPTKEVEDILMLHQAARKRKGIKSDGPALERLLDALFEEPDSHAWVVRHTDGRALASGLFHGDGQDRCIYGFGGQLRMDEPGVSSRATVLLIAAAMRHAAKNGASTFDFGGSADPGVDRFYAEFGAEKVDKVRIVQSAWWLKPALRFIRPDLMD